MPNSIVFVVPGSFETVSGGFEYDRHVVAGLRERGWTVAVCELDKSFPTPTPSALAAAARTLAAIPDGTTVVIDGLAFGAMPVEAEVAASRLQLVALVHHPLAAETGLDPATVEVLRTSERRALASARMVVVTSPATAKTLESYGVRRDRVVVVEPGTARAPLARGSQNAETQLLCVGALIPRKGHAVLVKALGLIRHLSWRLTCVGSLERHLPTVQEVRSLLDSEKLNDRVSLPGEVGHEQMSNHYAAADLFVLPTMYEGYGMAVAEALAQGLPVVATPTGGIRELIAGDPPAGLLVQPGDPAALAAALTRLLTDPEARARLAGGARRTRDRLPTWDQASVKMAALLTLNSEL